MTYKKPGSPSFFFRESTCLASPSVKVSGRATIKRKKKKPNNFSSFSRHKEGGSAPPKQPRPCFGRFPRTRWIFPSLKMNQIGKALFVFFFFFLGPAGFIRLHRSGSNETRARRTWPSKQKRCVRWLYPDGQWRHVVMTIFSISRARLVKMHRSSFHVRDCFFFLSGAPLKRKKDAAEKGQRQAGSEQLESAGPKYNPPTHLLLLLYIYIYQIRTWTPSAAAAAAESIKRLRHTRRQHTHKRLALSLSICLSGGWRRRRRRRSRGGKLADQSRALTLTSRRHTRHINIEKRYPFPPQCCV